MRSRPAEAGFSLIETMIAMIILVIGILGVAAMLANGLAYMNSSQAEYIAQQKAAEAVESIFTARDIGQTTWNSICNAGQVNVCSSGIFLVGPMPLCSPGPDGIIDTADDFNGTSCAGGVYAAPDAILVPNNAGNLNPPQRLTLSGFTRTIAFATVLAPNGTTIPNLRQITVTINYSSGNFKNRTYTLTAYISNVS